jgi:hypothetical protein
MPQGTLPAVIPHVQMSQRNVPELFLEGTRRAKWPVNHLESVMFDLAPACRLLAAAALLLRMINRMGIASPVRRHADSGFAERLGH